MISLPSIYRGRRTVVGSTSASLHVAKKSNHLSGELILRGSTAQRRKDAIKRPEVVRPVWLKTRISSKITTTQYRFAERAWCVGKADTHEAALKVQKAN